MRFRTWSIFACVLALLRAGECPSSGDASAPPPRFDGATTIAACPSWMAADATHLYSHIYEGRVFPVTFNVGDVLEGYSTIKRLADSLYHIVPGHDPAVMERYPAAAPGLEKFVVRLDVPPRKVS